MEHCLRSLWRYSEDHAAAESPVLFGRPITIAVRALGEGHIFRTMAISPVKAKEGYDDLRGRNNRSARAQQKLREHSLPCRSLRHGGTSAGLKYRRSGDREQNCSLSSS